MLRAYLPKDGKYKVVREGIKWLELIGYKLGNFTVKCHKDSTAEP